MRALQLLQELPSNIDRQNVPVGQQRVTLFILAVRSRVGRSGAGPRQIRGIKQRIEIRQVTEQQEPSKNVPSASTVLIRIADG